MELKIKPCHKNIFPLGGILVKNHSVAFWIAEMQRMQLSLKELQIYPVPGIIANSIWGCLIIPLNQINKALIGKNELCQQVTPNFFIPEKSLLYPAITNTEIEKLFSATPHIFHPSFGLVVLDGPLNLDALVLPPTLKSYYVTKPLTPVFIPGQVKSFQIKPVSPEEILKNLDENIFPKKEKMKDKPLSIFEHGKLALYKILFTKTKGNGKDEGSNIEKTGWWNKIAAMIISISKTQNKWLDKLQEDFEDLDYRNQKQFDKLMDLFKNNPEEALKYAIPLDEGGTMRGGGKGALDLSKRWFDFSLFGNNNISGGRSVDLGDHFIELERQYNATAASLIKQKEYHKAAFVYMKLLKQYSKAAETLEAGDFFQEAATIYLKHANNKTKAAECYEKGNMIMDAIDLYKSLNENEKVGDLYARIHKNQEASIYFEKVVNDYKLKNQFVKASLIYTNKMKNEAGGQSLLLEGWRSNKDAVNCLNNYFSNIHDIKQLSQQINAVYSSEVTKHNRESFLQVIRYEYNKKNELAEGIKEIAYEIVAEHVHINPAIVTQLKGFNNDKELIKDTIRFTVNLKQLK